MGDRRTLLMLYCHGYCRKKSTDIEIIFERRSLIFEEINHYLNEHLLLTIEGIIK